MTNKAIINQLENNKQVFKNLLFGKTEEEYLWRPKPGKWSLLEIVCHLVDEERDDFRARTKLILENPLKEMAPINPEGWVLERGYASKNYHDTLQMFIEERGKSIAWLNTQINSNWDNKYVHPKLGEMSAQLFLNNWLAHDYLHIRQIIRYQYYYLKEKGGTGLRYAGDW